MGNSIWMKAHGATIHFPIALLLCSLAFDTFGLIFGERPFVRDFHGVGYWTIILAAAGSLPAVASGIVMTKGNILGHGILRLHHLFVWPAFGLLVGLATWRALVGRRPANARLIFVYLGTVAVAAGLMSAAGYWGGELMIHA